MQTAHEDSSYDLPTPTRFLMECDEWNISTLGIMGEVDPFEAQFNNSSNNKQSQPQADTWAAPHSPECQPNETPVNEASPTESIPPTPPVTASRTPSIESSVSPKELEPLQNSPPSQYAMGKPHTMSSEKPATKIEETPLPDAYVFRQEDGQSLPRARAAKRNAAKALKEQDLDDDLESESSSSSGNAASSGRKRRIVFEGDDAEEQRKRFLERNRVAAFKCRQKKKKWMQELEYRSDQVINQHKELQAIVMQLREESMFLRNQLLAHSNCNCTAVQTYLKRTSEQLTSDPSIMGSPSLRTPAAAATAAAAAAAVSRSNDLHYDMQYMQDSAPGMPDRSHLSAYMSMGKPDYFMTPSYPLTSTSG
ncbi:uncharacterized protein BYT42DRAFT_602874 [Radiomyces spectabilis]|uniref:uncharacterized protein n=1 Tax=Radiomyces spectabilis TaxID=64574 RepID=UPI0022200562|nr:uncharacterized protein BYT42DRAFT_602874 [Radiomyces spectabilis]KAI8388324.1 hypothetical protein BYT42DRAFT_602874 [Radiomyces spectabilis]